ncbi:MAG: S16 family serine protease [Acidimicrobiales bacterium]
MTDITEIEANSDSLPSSTERRPGSGGLNIARYLAIGAGLLGVALVTMSLVTVPYFSQSPGSATPLESLVVVEGAPSYPSDGEVYFTTVRLTGELSVLEYIGAWFDSSVELVESKQVLQGQTREEQRAHNLALMTESQEVAKRVALSYLGYDVIRPNGALIAGVVEGSGAQDVVKAGDVVVEAGGVEVTERDGLVDQIQARSPGDTLDMVVMRPLSVDESERIEVSVVLGASEADGTTQMGVQVSTAIELVPLPFDIQVDTASVGGPSAGLALTLSMFDLLTPGDATGGIEVATTGQIDLAGNVLPIGGITQKTHAVRRAGIDLFLVPVANYDEALAASGGEVEIVAVENFLEALTVLSERGGNGLEVMSEPALSPAA